MAKNCSHDVISTSAVQIYLKLLFSETSRTTYVPPRTIVALLLESTHVRRVDIRRFCPLSSLDYVLLRVSCMYVSPVWLPLHLFRLSLSERANPLSHCFLFSPSLHHYTVVESSCLVFFIMVCGLRPKLKMDRSVGLDKLKSLTDRLVGPVRSTYRTCWYKYVSSHLWRNHSHRAGPGPLTSDGHPWHWRTNARTL